MKISLTLNEAIDRCDNVDYFLNEEGWDRYAIIERGGDLEIELEEEDARKYGIIS